MHEGIPQPIVFEPDPDEDMPATPPSAEERARFGSLKEAYLRDRQDIEAMRSSADYVKATSSFYDVSGNLIAAIGGGVRNYEYSRKPETLAALAENIDYLDRYLDFIRNADEETRKRELSERDGAFPEIRQAADEAAQAGSAARPILFYIDQITGTSDRRSAN